MDAPEIRRELDRALRQINSQMEEIRQEAVRSNIPPVVMLDSYGNHIWSPLVVAKAQVLHAIVLMHDEQGKSIKQDGE